MGHVLSMFHFDLNNFKKKNQSIVIQFLNYGIQNIAIHLLNYGRAMLAFTFSFFQEMYLKYCTSYVKLAYPKAWKGNAKEIGVGCIVQRYVGREVCCIFYMNI
jgi:hypothetical protein